MSPLFPLPPSPTRGEVPLLVFGPIEENTPGHTLPFMGRDGEGKYQAPHNA
jgi:hypothetical protein